MIPPDEHPRADWAPDFAPRQSNAAVWIILGAAATLIFAAGVVVGVMWCAL